MLKSYNEMTSDQKLAYKMGREDQRRKDRRTFIVSQRNALHKPTCDRVKGLKNPRIMKLMPDEVEAPFWSPYCCWQYSRTTITSILGWLQ